MVAIVKMPVSAAAAAATLLLAVSLLAASSFAEMTLKEGSVFTSSGNIHALFTHEKELGGFLDSFVAQQEARLNDLKNLVQKMKSVVPPSADDDLEPFEGFSLLSRMNELGRKVDELLSGSSMLDLEQVMKQSTLPNRDDLEGAAKAMLRLQRVYNIGPADLMPEGTPTDYHFVARNAYVDDDHGSATIWFEAAMDKLKDAEHANPSLLVDVLDHLSFLKYKLQDFNAAIDLSNQLLALAPNNTRVAQNIEYYRTALERAGTEAALATRQAGDFNHDKDNILGHSDRDTERFRRLCRGEKLYKPTIPLMCMYKTYGKKHLTYQPIKVEYLHEGRQRLQIFRGLATPKECMHLREEGGALLQRAVAWTDGAFKPVEFRISTAAWLEPDHDETVKAIHERIEDATQVDIKYAEQLQVSNYGMGGFYECHFDHSKRKSHPHGERVATFMIYLNDVKAGGFTVFPRLGAAVKPGLGDAVFWYNLLPSGASDDNTLHAACPVLKGSKWVANKWIHEKNNVCRKPLPHEKLSPETLI